MALTDMNEALLNNSYDYEPTSQTLIETWENSFSYLLALQQAYIKYEYFEAISGNDPDYADRLDWSSTRDRKVIGHLYLDKFNRVKFDIDYDIIHLTKRENYRKSYYYQKSFSMDDIMMRSDIFRYMPIVFIDDKIQWDYTMRVSEEGTEFTTLFDRNFIVEHEREWDEEKQEYGDIIYKTHKIQVIIIETKYAWRFKSSPRNITGPFKIESNQIVFEPNHSDTNYEEEAILNTWTYRFNNFVQSKRVSAFWQKPLNGFDAPAAIGKTIFEAINKRGGAYVKETSIDGYPEFFVEKYTVNADYERYGYMENVSGTERIDMLTREGRKNILYPYLNEFDTNRHVMQSDSGTLFYAIQLPNDYGKEWWHNGSTLFPMTYDETSDSYKGEISQDYLDYFNSNPNQDFFIIFIYIDELKRISIPSSDTVITRSENGTLYNYSYVYHDEITSIRSFPPFEVGNESISKDNVHVFTLHNMPIPTTNFIMKFKNRENSVSPEFYRSEDLIDIHYPNFYTWKSDTVNTLIEKYGESIQVEIYKFYHEDEDHKYRDIFDFYRKYLYEAYLATYTRDHDHLYEDELIFAYLKDKSYPSSLNLESYAEEYANTLVDIYFKYEFPNYQYGETDYLHKWLRDHPNSNPVEYKIEKLREWIKWDPEALRKYVLHQNKLGSRFGLFCCDINMNSRRRTDSFREMADREYLYVFIEEDNTVAYEAEEINGEWQYKLVDGEKVLVIPDTDVAYIDCGSATLPCKMYRYTGNSLPGRRPQYVFQSTIRYFRDDNGNPEVRYVFSMNNNKPYPLLLDVRIFVNGIMVVDLYQERKLFLDYFYIPASYFTIDEEGHSDDYIEIEMFPSFDIRKSVHFNSVDDEKTFLLFEPTTEDYYNEIAPLSSQDSKQIPMYEKIDYSEEVYIKPITPNYSMKDNEGNLYIMNKEATYSGKSEHLGEFTNIYYNQVLEMRNTFYDGKPDNIYISEINHTYRMTNNVGLFIRNIPHEEIKRLIDGGSLLPYDTTSWKQMTQAYYHRDVIITENGAEYTYSDPVLPRTDTIYKELSGSKPFKWYFWDGFRFIYYDEKNKRQNVWPTVVDAYFTDTYDDNPSISQYQSRFHIYTAEVTAIYEDGEINVLDRTDEKSPHEFTRLTKFKIKPKDEYSNLINRDVFFHIHKKSICYEVRVEKRDEKPVTYVVLEIKDKNFNYDEDYIRIYINGRLLSPKEWKLRYSFNQPRIYLLFPVKYEDKIFVDITPYQYKRVFYKETIDPLNEIIDLKGTITKPFDARYYDVYLNGRKLNINNITNINPWSITLTNVKSKWDLEIFEKERDWEYYGMDFSTDDHPYSFDDLLKTGMVPDSIKYKIVIDLINDLKDERYIIVPNEDSEPRWFNQIDYREWAEFEIFYFDVLIPKNYMNPDRLQFSKELLEEDFSTIHDNYVIDPVEDTSDEAQKERRQNHPKVVMLDPDLTLKHPDDVPYPEDPEAIRAIDFSVGHPLNEVNETYLRQDISSKLQYESNI